MMTVIRKATGPGVVDLPDLDGAFVEIIEQTCIDAHFTKVLTERLPVGSAAAGRTVMDADHSVAPDIGFRLAGNADLIGREICNPPGKPTAQGAVAVSNPCRGAEGLDTNFAAMTTSIDGHGRL